MSAPLPLKVGVIGTGNISDIYLEQMQRFAILDLVAVADLDLERARAQAGKHGVGRVQSVQEMLEDPGIELIVNLTVPAAHFEVALRALEAGKHVYNEKPLALALEQGRQLMAVAGQRGLRVGGAPDTFLGAGLQTARALLDAGEIGEAVYASGAMLSAGPDDWHPNPGFFYGVGGGPMFDMAPYYLTALMSLLGRVERVSGSALTPRTVREVRVGPAAGQRLEVQTPTTVSSVLDFAGGTLATLTTSFDVDSGYDVHLRLYGTQGALELPDPNTFGGELKLRNARTGGEWQSVPLERPYAENSRSLGVADLAHGLRSGQPHRASGAQALHVLEIMHAVHTASREGRHVQLETPYTRPTPLEPEVLHLRP